MDVFEALITRRSIRKYTGEKISDSIIEKLLFAAMHAPSAVNCQPWDFIVFRNRNTIDAIVEIHRNAAMLQHSDAAILVCWDENRQHDKGYGPVDCAAATQNILLAAHGFGMVQYGLASTPGKPG
jgi:nitroreductase